MYVPGSSQYLDKLWASSTLESAAVDWEKAAVAFDRS
jgi:hypothetical protein